MSVPEIFCCIAAVFDIMIFVWLVGTWFFEGHHKQCKVDVIATFTCAECKKEFDVETEVDCSACAGGHVEES